jgi:predicted phosphodiesterase
MLSNLSYPLFTESNKNLTINSIDVVSDLHIDQWDVSLNIENPCGEVSNSPYKFKETSNRILVIAGDISDDIDLSINYLNDISANYEKVIFVDGNHEHVSNYPNLLSVNEIYEKINKLGNNKIVYLPKTHYKMDKTVFIGFSGWWDYDNRNQSSMERASKYFDDWIPKISKSDGGSRKFIENVISKSEQQHLKLIEQLEYYEKQPDIENIVIVTHTVPLKEFALESKGNIETSCQLQTFSKTLVDGRYKKLNMWIFGHTHNQFEKTINGVRFLAHPRGRPEDFNRKEYDLKSIN